MNQGESVFAKFYGEQGKANLLDSAAIFFYHL